MSVSDVRDEMPVGTDDGPGLPWNGALLGVLDNGIGVGWKEKLLLPVPGGGIAGCICAAGVKIGMDPACSIDEEEAMS